MTDYHLISHHLCPYVQRAVITLTEKGIEHKRTYLDLSDKPGWFRAISPLGKVPLLQVGDAAIFESAVICEYLDETTPESLHPSDAVSRAIHRSWIEFASATLDAIAAFYNAPNAESFEARTRGLRDRLGRLDRQLTAGPYFAGARFHLVDAAWAPVFRYFDTFDTIADFGLLDGLERVKAYRATLAARPSVQTAVPKGYPARLRAFLRRRDCHLAGLMEGKPEAMARVCDLGA